MKHIVEYNQYSESPEEKLNNIVEDILHQEGGGEQFFDRIDDVIKDPKNLDITLSLFNKIYEKYNHDYNLVVSGSFGKKLLELNKKGKIHCSGTFVLMVGSITSHQNKMGLITKNKEVKIEFQDEEIEKGKEFIFVDDSYYSGTTYKLIKKFLEDRGSTIKEVYVIYDGNDKKEDNRYSLYSYYDKHSGRELVAIDPKYFRPSEVEQLLGNPTKANTVLGWKPKIAFNELVKIMVDHDCPLNAE